MVVFCGLCQCEPEDSWEEHTQSQQHQNNLADPVIMEAAKIRHEMEFEKTIERQQGANNGQP